MDSNWSTAPTDQLQSHDIADVVDTGVADIGLPPQDAESKVQIPIETPAARPQLARNQPAPPPPHQPPPPPAPQTIGLPQDSLSLAQLKKIVQDFPHQDLTEYDFTYSDTASFEEELDEWFSYGETQTTALVSVRSTFERRWDKYKGGDFFDAEMPLRTAFVEQEILGLSSPSGLKRCKSLRTLTYIVLGVWFETAGILGEDDDDMSSPRAACTQSQLAAIKYGCKLLTQCDAIRHVYSVWRNASEYLLSERYRQMDASCEEATTAREEFDNSATILYVVVECARIDTTDLELIQHAIAVLRPEPIDYFVTLFAKLRWDDVYPLPQNKIFLMFWKFLLASFGSSEYQREAKEALRECRQSNDVIVSSPLEYHMFRQEITSKYPAYSPPPPLISLDAAANSMLPPIASHKPRHDAPTGISAASTYDGGTSILHQPVHIATPAPSPPPSPAIGGKAGKKQNYQTNQNFPFMYPPLDQTSNSAGGKGTAGLQDSLVGRRWHGSEIPVSILEAGELFAARTKMTRAIRQLWDEREKFLKFERGWNDEGSDLMRELDGDLDALELEQLLERRLADAGDDDDDGAAIAIPKADYGPNQIDANLKSRLDRIESFYRSALPDLQSVVIVLLKAVLANVTALVTQPAYPPTSQEAAGSGNGVGQRRGTNPPPPQPVIPFDVKSLPMDELDLIRSREITSKAVAGILLLLLKWFKISHVLKFEYLTQLLLDSNYMPLVLKLFAHSDVDKMVNTNAERIDFTFFYFCNFDSRQPVSDSASESSDDAVPPPINRQPREPVLLPTLPITLNDDNAQSDNASHLIDDASYPRTEPGHMDTPGSHDQIHDAVSTDLRTDFSWRNLHSSINYLRILQKVCKSKAHRNLLLVQFKSSTIFKKSLKVPDPLLRLYTLKLFKGQVPYCGRKWRQQNMKVITYIYLYCKLELKDDWLAGTDVDGDIEESLPLEQALRALTQWYNVQSFPGQMGIDEKLLKSERDFFAKELEKMAIDEPVEEAEEDEDNEFES